MHGPMNFKLREVNFFEVAIVGLFMGRDTEDMSVYRRLNFC